MGLFICVFKIFTKHIKFITNNIFRSIYEINESQHNYFFFIFILFQVGDMFWPICQAIFRYKYIMLEEAI